MAVKVSAGDLLCSTGCSDPQNSLETPPLGGSAGDPERLPLSHNATSGVWRIPEEREPNPLCHFRSTPAHMSGEMSRTAALRRIPAEPQHLVSAGLDHARGATPPRTSGHVSPPLDDRATPGTARSRGRLPMQRRRSGPERSVRSEEARRTPVPPSKREALARVRTDGEF